MENYVGVGKKLKDIFGTKNRRFMKGKFNKNIARIRRKYMNTLSIFIIWKELRSGWIKKRGLKFIISLINR